MQQGGTGELLGGWVHGALTTSLPQVFSHGICFGVEISSMDTFLSHDNNQYWSKQKEEKTK